MRLSYILKFVLIAAVLSSCKERFKPDVLQTNSNLLVVEGFINTGNDSTIITLSRTVFLDDKQAIKPEAGATVMVESETNETYALIEKGNGVYGAPSLNLSASKKYRLKIKTSTNTNYLSDFVSAKESPPIDDVTWKIGANGLQIAVNTHDETQNSRYYRWEYTDTWIFYAPFQSVLMFNGVEVVERNLTTHQIFQCWGNYNSSTILLGSTAKLEKDVIFESPITLIDHHAERLGEKYSILVKQYALTKEAYQFYEQLKKNTETLGSIFDAQPSEIKGNIHNENVPDEPVLGYISAGTVQQKRIFIVKKDLPPSFFLKKNPRCVRPPFVVIPKSQAELVGFFASGINIPIDYAPEGGYYSSGRECADCTLTGTNKRPSFWQ
ncbi:DUF4249 domain-containing protein [Pedobacter insulae]|uniref:DUF4249 domain-containing protein n=1 Tax=Pedobacter insulae TaxID=414048 RepID=A0A1I2Y354_9SPHI|nr:DUF4249 domain-containing protein [Pedobacter insulae]SFH19787.1 protein of unknown function [Pedobacter insulae]